jgi:hypothetical protein
MNLALTLAMIAQLAYSPTPAGGLPRGFHPARLAGVDLREGVFARGLERALVVDGVVDGARTLVVAYEGSNAAEDWLRDLRDINTGYAELQPLTKAIETYASNGGRVLLVGHSKGGAMAQLFMYAHAHDGCYRAVTFGSPGARPQARVFGPRADARITNYAVADDPFVFFGEHRAEVAADGRRRPLRGLLLALGIAWESGLPLFQVLASASRASADYVNNGAQVRLSGKRPRLTLAGVLASDPAEHDVDTYVKRLKLAAVPEPRLWP